MEKDKSKSNLPSTSDGIKTQEEADRLLEEETTMSKEVEHFLQEELDKLLAEKEPIPESKELLRRSSQEFRSSEKLKVQPKKLKFGVEKTRVEEDLLTLLDEPWDNPKDSTRGEVEDPWDSLSLFDESMLELKPLARRGGPSRLEEEEEVSEEEEEKKEEGRPLEGKEEHLVKMSTKERQHLMKPVFLDYLEEEDNLKDGSKHNLRSMRSSIGNIFEHQLQHLQNLKGTMQKKKISTLPLGYFSKFSKRLTSREAAEGEAGTVDEQSSQVHLNLQWEGDTAQHIWMLSLETHSRGQLMRPDGQPSSEEPEPRNWIPWFLKKSKPKRIASFRTKTLKSQLERGQVTDLSKIFSDDFFRSQDTGASEDIPEEDLPPSPEDMPQQSEEESKRIQEETKKQEDAPGSSLWHMGQRTSPWEMGHSREFSENLFKDKAYKQKFGKHERDSKVSVPLPLQELMEEEVLAILKATLLSYQRKLGANHPLTEQMEQQVDKLHLQLQGRGII